MKKVNMILCLCLCVLLFCSCSQKDMEFIKPANFYYCNRTVSYNTPSGVISPEIRESDGMKDDIEKYMHAYLRGPVSDELFSVIPEGTALLSLQVREGAALLHFSKELAELSGIELTTAGACLVRSLNGFAGIQTVVLSADGALLDERETYTLSLEDIVMMDTVTMEE